METHDVQKFADELRWCINQLEMGLQRQSPDSRQAQETIKILKILRSAKAPLIKKRQAMRNALGDYRKKMKDEEKRSLNAMKHSKFKPRDNMKVFKKSKFLRQSHSKQSLFEHQNQASLDLNMKLDSLNLDQLSAPQASSPPTLSSDNANLPPFESLSHEQNISVDGNNVGLNEKENQNFNPVSNLVTSNTASNYNCNEPSFRFKFCPSNNSFVFGFGMEEDRENSENVLNNECNRGGETEANNCSKIDSECFVVDASQNAHCNNAFKYVKSDNSFSFDFGS